jgi:hypothetical protein
VLGFLVGPSLSFIVPFVSMFPAGLVVSRGSSLALLLAFMSGLLPRLGLSKLKHFAQYFDKRLGWHVVVLPYLVLTLELPH